MINISIPAIWIAFLETLFGAMLGVALSFWIIKREVQREVRRIENEYKFLLVQGLVGGVMKYFLKTKKQRSVKKMQNNRQNSDYNKTDLGHNMPRSVLLWEGLNRFMNFNKINACNIDNME